MTSGCWHYFMRDADHTHTRLICEHLHDYVLTLSHSHTELKVGDIGQLVGYLTSILKGFESWHHIHRVWWHLCNISTQELEAGGLEGQSSFTI